MKAVVSDASGRSAARTSTSTADALVDALRGDRTVHKIIIECWPQ